MKKKIEYRLFLSERELGEIHEEYLYKSYSNVNIGIKMRDYFQNIIDTHGFVRIPDNYYRECEFNHVILEVEYAED